MFRSKTPSSCRFDEPNHRLLTALTAPPVVMAEHTYSISIMFAGLICGPVALGPAANVAVISVITLFGDHGTL